MQIILDWLNANSNALMVIITFVYVVATIAISAANIKSANASREQLEESKRQYKDKKRLEIMPYFNLYFKDGEPLNDLPYYLITRDSDKPFISEIYEMIIENAGKGLAKNICVKFITELAFLKNEPIVDLPLLSENRTQSIYLGFAGETDTIKKEQIIKTCFSISFEDLFGNKYQQNIDLSFSCHDNELYICKTYIRPPELN